MANKKRLIDANELKNRMFNYYGCVNEHTSKSTYAGETLMNYEVADLIEDCIDNAPTVDAVEVVHGRWDDSGRYIFPNGSIAVRCTECGCALNMDEFEKYYWHYCPNCGAKMDGDGR